MGAFGEALAAMGTFAGGYAELILKDVRAQQFARKPRFETPGGGTVVDTNHPAFNFGHLALYPHRAFSLTGASGAHIEAPAAWQDLFKAGAPCLDDPSGTIYPAMNVLTEAFFKHHKAAVEHIRSVGDDVLAGVNPNEAARSRFPTVGAAVGFLLHGHVMVHMGQLSAWRRCFGMPSAMG